MKSDFFRITAAALVLLLLLSGCGGSDKPPDDGTPAPPELNGTFSCAYGSMTFNGDGSSVRLDLTGDFAALAGLPEGVSEGSYAFLFHNGLWRYDKAESLRLVIGDTSVTFRNAPGQTSEGAVAFWVSGSDELYRFEKEG